MQILRNEGKLDNISDPFNLRASSKRSRKRQTLSSVVNTLQHQTIVSKKEHIMSKREPKEKTQILEISEYDYLEFNEISEYDYLSPDELAEMDIDEDDF